VVAVVVATGLAGAACRGHSVAPGEARLVPSGRVEVQRSGHAFQRVTHATTLHRGDQVRVATGTARMELSGRRGIELRNGSQMALGAAPELVSADALLTALGSRLTVVVGGTRVVLTDGAARLANRRGAVVVAVYRGSADVDSAGRRVDGGVPALRQITVAAPGLIQDHPSPLDYDEARPDPWDLRFLSDAIALGVDLTSRSRAITAATPTNEGSAPGFYRLLVPDLARQPLLDQSLVDQLRASGARPTGETLVGLAISGAGTRGEFGERVRSVFGFRDQGARWGLVAFDQGVDRVAVMQHVEQALGKLAGSSPIGLAAGGGLNQPVTSPTQPPATTPPTPSTQPRPPPTSPTTRPVVPPPPQTGTPADPSAKSLVDTINGLLGPVIPPPH
jgi:hypothetical protein